MQYFLAFDKGLERKGNDRFVVIPNRLIHPSLDCNNNLKILCDFTTSFSNEEELRETIISLNKDLTIYRACDLVVLWKRKIDNEETIKWDNVPYKDYAKYFDISFLIEFIVNRVYTTFFEDFCKQYENHNYLKKELGALREVVECCGSKKEIENKVLYFLKKALYGKNGLEYNKMYKLVMFIARHNEEILECSTRQNEIQEFEQEWLEHRARLRQKN